MRITATSALPAVALLPILMALSADAAGAQTVRGLLLEAVTDRPIDLGTVTFLNESGDTVASALSDESGFFTGTAPEGGTLRLVVRALGYRAQGVGPFELESGGVQVVQVTMEPAPVPIAGVGVDAEAVTFEEEVRYLDVQGFYDRAKTAIGHFITPAELEREVALRNFTGEIFYGIPGVRVSRDGRNVMMRSVTGGLCGPTVFMDGVRVSGETLRLVSLDGLVPLEAVEAIEVYTRPARVPVQFMGAGQGCGAVVVWTKH